MTTSSIQDDPYVSAMNATEQPQDRTIFGQVVTIDPWFCVLERGAGKRPFDPTRDTPDQRRTAIKISIECAKRDGGTYTIDQDCLDFEKAWLKHTLQSLRQLGITDLRGLKGAWVQARRVSTGETYTKKGTNEVKEKTAIEFEAVFPSRQLLDQARATFFATRTHVSGAAHAGVQAVDLPPLNEATDSTSAERQFALTSLPALWAASGHDAQRFTAMIEQNPLISKHYPPTHPQVQALIAGRIGEDEDDDLPF